MTITISTGLHALIMWLAFRRLSGSELREAAAVEGQSRRKLTVRISRFLSGAAEASAYGVNMAIFSLMGVLAMLVLGELRRVPLLMLLAAILVAIAWLDVLITYALAYATADTAEEHFQFPGDASRDKRAFSDYLYLSAAVQASYGTGDIATVTSAMRRTVTKHKLLAFAFNSVIIALIVSLALSVGLG